MPLHDGCHPIDSSNIVEASAAVVEMLITTHWLAEHEAGDRQAIGRALNAMAIELLTARAPKIFR